MTKSIHGHFVKHILFHFVVYPKIESHTASVSSISDGKQRLSSASTRPDWESRPQLQTKQTAAVPKCLKIWLASSTVL